jgi:hypothetical protein
MLSKPFSFLNRKSLVMITYSWAGIAKSVVTDHGLDYRGLSSSMGSILSDRPLCLDILWKSPSFLSNEDCRLFPQYYSSKDVKLWPFHLVPREIMHQALPPPPIHLHPMMLKAQHYLNLNMEVIICSDLFYPSPYSLYLIPSYLITSLHLLSWDERLIMEPSVVQVRTSLKTGYLLQNVKAKVVHVLN